jgi:hypothetical protein
LEISVMTKTTATASASPSKLALAAGPRLDWSDARRQMQLLRADRPEHAYACAFDKNANAYVRNVIGNVNTQGGARQHPEGFSAQ